MQQYLPILPKPSRYIGIEEGAVFKELSSVRLRIALAFPDMYEVGMSYLGQKILYGLINQKDGWWAERVFAPCPDAGKILKDNQVDLCSLESTSPLKDFDIIGFSLTHELCYTNILYMLDLAGIPFYAKDRGEEYPLIVAGGGCTLAAEPVAPFFDALMLGDGEDMLIELMQEFEKSKEKKESKLEILEKLAKIPGVYVPSFFEDSCSHLPPKPLKSDYHQVKRRIVPDLNSSFYPTQQVIPFGAVHNRLSLEIARGCTRSCRFCQAGMVYRPVRERKVKVLDELLNQCLTDTGYDGVSYLSLSTGDFSALKTLFNSTIERCAKEQVSVSLPSLRVGSIDDSIMERMANIKRTGATLAPEAGSQRMRNVINKGITEEEIILHAQKLFEHGWQQIKLYFMIGLPTETDDDLRAIVDLCRKVRDSAGPGVKRLQVTAALSPFVPKPHTPFQWSTQISLKEMTRRTDFVFQLIRQEKRMRMRWHEPEMSFLEGIFSRGDRRLAQVVEKAYAKKAIFCSWMDYFKLEPWLEALEECNLQAAEFTASHALDSALPWEHLQSGLSKEFLKTELERSLQEKTTDDCRYYSCKNCGVCDINGKVSNLKNTPEDSKTGLENNQLSPAEAERYKLNESFNNKLNFQARDQEAHAVKLDEHGRVLTKSFDEPKKAQNKNLPPALAEGLGNKVKHYSVWYKKTNLAVYLSQLELQAIFERAMRRKALPLSFSRGFNPAPLLSFARALPVAVASEIEWFTLYLREDKSAKEVFECFKGLPQGLEVFKIEELAGKLRPEENKEECYLFEFVGSPNRFELFLKAFSALQKLNTLSWVKVSKKRKRILDLKSFIKELKIISENSFAVTFNWEVEYSSPLTIMQAALGLSLHQTENSALNLTEETELLGLDFFKLHELKLTKISASS